MTKCVPDFVTCNVKQFEIFIHPSWEISFLKSNNLYSFGKKVQPGVFARPSLFLKSIYGVENEFILVDN
jgi:hypothetical protein